MFLTQYLTPLKLAVSENMIFPCVSVHNGCVHTLQLLARNCQFGPNSQQKLSHCKFCSKLSLAARKANFVDFPRFPGSVLNGADFLGGSQLVTGIQTGGNLHSESSLFNKSWNSTKNVTVWLGFQRKPKALWSLHRRRFIECRQGISYIFGALAWRNHNSEPLLE